MATEENKLLALRQALRLPAYETDPDVIRHRVGQTYGCGWQDMPHDDRRRLDAIIITEMTHNETKRQQ